MKFSYNWLKWYVPEAPEAQKLADIITYHLAEVETIEEFKGDKIFEIKILPNRAHDLLSHMGLAREIASLLNIVYTDPTLKYKIPTSGPTQLKIEVESDKCRRYLGRIIRNVKIGPSPDWVVQHLASIGQRSINNIVDAANLVMFNCGQPTHAFDFDKVKEKIVVRLAEEGEPLVTLDKRDLKLKKLNLVIADAETVLGVAGIKGGKSTEVDEKTQNLIIEVANFDPVFVRKTAQSLGIFTDARKRFENDLSPELAPYGMRELSALIFEMCPEALFEDTIDIYPKKQEKTKLSFSVKKISKILGVLISTKEVENILKRYLFEYESKGDVFEITVPPMRLDLIIEEDMAEEIGRVLGYDKLKSEIPKISFKPKTNETYAKISWTRNTLLADGYSEVMTYAFASQGEVEVLESTSDKKFLRANLGDGLKESMKLNKTNFPLLGSDEVRIFEIGTVFLKTGEEIHVAYGNKKEVKEMTLDEFYKDMLPDFKPEARSYNLKVNFQMWSLFPFIARDVAVWVSEGVESSKVVEVIKENAGELMMRGPELFDEFKKDGKTSYAFRLVFQSYDKTLTDDEINKTMSLIKDALEKNGWKVR